MKVRKNWKEIWKVCCISIECKKKCLWKSVKGKNKSKKHLWKSALWSAVRQSAVYWRMQETNSDQVRGKRTLKDKRLRSLVKRERWKQTTEIFGNRNILLGSVSSISPAYCECFLLQPTIWPIYKIEVYMQNSSSNSSMHNMIVAANPINT